MKRYCICTVLMLCFALAAKGGELPDTLDIWIGGFFGPSYNLRLTNNVVEYRASKRGTKGEEKKLEIITPTEVQWKAFRTTLDEIGIWNWKTNYVDPSVQDGTQWSITVKYGQKQTKIDGLNAYPDGNGPKFSPKFERLLEAVKQLLAGREFR